MTSSGAVPVPIEELVESTVGPIEEIRARPIDLGEVRRTAHLLRLNPFENLERLVDQALHPRTDEYLIVTDVDADADALRGFLRRHFFAYRALRSRLMRDPFARSKLKEGATGWFGRVTSIDVFRFIAAESGGAAAVSLDARAAVFILPGFDHPETARISLEESARGRLVVSQLGDYSDPDLLSFVVRLHTRHEAAHSEDGIQHTAGLRTGTSPKPSRTRR